MEFKQASPACLKGRFETTGPFDIPFLFISDVDFDSVYCDRELLRNHLEEAKAKGAYIFCFGDFFDLMGGRYDPRRTLKGIRPEYKTDNYLDTVINDAANFLLPFIDVFKFISYGNHEKTILKNLSVDPLERLCTILNMRGGRVFKGNYAGYLWFQRQIQGTSNHRDNKKIFYHHGKYGGVITKGILGVSRFASVVADADLIVTGHNHAHWMVTHPRYRLTIQGNVKLEDQIHIKTGTYKRGFEGDMNSWEVEKIVMPQPLRHWWVHLYGHTKKMEISVYPTQ